MHLHCLALATLTAEDCHAVFVLRDKVTSCNMMKYALCILHSILLGQNTIEAAAVDVYCSTAVVVCWQLLFNSAKTILCS